MRSHRKSHASCDISQVAPAAACICHGNGRIIIPSHLQNECASEPYVDKIAHAFFPIDFSISRWPVIIVGTAIVVSVNHSEMTGEFMNEVMNVAAEISMTCIETSADFRGIDSIQNP